MSQSRSKEEVYATRQSDYKQEKAEIFKKAQEEATERAQKQEASQKEEATK